MTFSVREFLINNPNSTIIYTAKPWQKSDEHDPWDESYLTLDFFIHDGKDVLKVTSYIDDLVELPDFYNMIVKNDIYTNPAEYVMKKVFQKLCIPQEPKLYKI